MALAALVLCLGGQAAAQPQPQSQPPNREVTVQNETDLILREFYLAPRNAPDRGPDRLGAEVVAPGASFRIRLGRTRDCAFDAVAVFADGSEERRDGLDICRATRIVFGDPSLPTLEVTVTNRSGVMLRELYASASGAAAWGPDRLGSAVIEPGGRFALRLRTRDCVFDLRAVYADDREEVRARADLCGSPSLVFDRGGVPRGPARSVVLANRHLAPIHQVYLSAVTEPDWGPDRLGAATLAVDEDAMIATEGGCEADLRIVFANGGAEERRALDICATTRVVVRPGWVVAERLDEEDPVPGPSAGPSANALRLRNLGPLPIVEIYTATPGGAAGEDRLGADTLPIGAIIELDPAEPEACIVDLLAVFRDGREVRREGVNLCTGEELDIR